MKHDNSARKRSGFELTMNELASKKISWKNPKVYCVAVILVGLLIVIASNAMTMRFGRPHLTIRAFGLVFAGLGLFGILLAGFAERTVRAERLPNQVVIAKRVVRWEQRVSRILGIAFSVMSMFWLLQCVGSVLFSRLPARGLLHAAPLFFLCVGMATLSFVVESLASKR